MSANSVKKGTEAVEGLIWNLQRIGRINLSTNAFKVMKKLRLLKLDGVNLVGDFGCVSKQLRWANWQGFSFECIPDDFYQENLVVFELKYSNIKQVWKETKETITELETTHEPQCPDLPLRSLLIGVGSCDVVIDTLSNSISQALTGNFSSDSFLPGDNYPSWSAFTCEGPSVPFVVPEQDSEYCMKGITFCVVYSSTPDCMETECLTSFLITNHTKSSIQICKQDTVMSFNDGVWQGVKSNLDVGDNVEICVTSGHGMIVKEIGVYLIYGKSMTLGIDPSNESFARFVRRMVECLLCLKED